MVAIKIKNMLGEQYRENLFIFSIFLSNFRLNLLQKELPLLVGKFFWW